MIVRLALCTAVAAMVCSVIAIDASAQTYEVTKLVPGSAFHGVHGLGIDKSGRLFAGSVVGAALYEVDRNSGTAKIVIPPPEGMADDMAFAPDGTMAWTGFRTGDLYSRKDDGPIKKLASGLPGINSLAFRKDGRLYATTVFLGDALYEIDVEGTKPPRMILEKMGGLNGFQFEPDDLLYGPLQFKCQVVKVDVDMAKLTVVVDGFKVLPKTGAKKVVAQLKPSLDNLVIDNDRIYVSNMADNGIQEVDPETGAAKQVISGKLAVPAGIGVVSDGGKDTIYVADVFAYRTVDGATGEVSEVARMFADGVMLEFPTSATASRDTVILSSRGWGSVQVIDRKTGKTIEMLHGFKEPYGAIKLDDGSLLVNELGTKSLLHVSGDNGKERTTVIGELGGPMGLVAGPAGSVYLTEAFSGQVSNNRQPDCPDRRRRWCVRHDLFLVGLRERHLQDHEEVEQKSFQRDPLVSDGGISFGQTAKPSTRRKHSGQSRRFDRLPATSGLPRSTDIARGPQLVWFVPQPDSSATVGMAGLLFNNLVGSEAGLAPIAKQHNVICCRPLAVFSARWRRAWVLLNIRTMTASGLLSW
jgi:DNA-binding beta-propeller fold protein YncE